MDTQNETTTTNTQSAGDIMQKSRADAIRKIVIFAGIAVYLAGIAYAETHALNVLSQGVNPDFLVWAYIGMVALGITAVVLPLALHFWTFEAMHRTAAFAFYAVDLLLLGINSFVDFSVNTGEQLAPWAQNYFDYILPSTPVIAAVGWSVLFLLDPAARAHILGETLRASIREALSQQIVEAAKGGNVTQAVNAAARAEVDKSLSDLFGRDVVIERRRTFNLLDGNIPHPTDAGKAAAMAEAKAFGMWNPNDPNDTPFERSRPDVHEALTQAAGTESEFALPCGHTRGETWNKDRQLHECNVCGAVRAEELKAANQEDQPATGSPFPGSES